jgi:hypothetical protein
MPAVLTHKTIMLLAQERVKDIRRILQARIDSGAPDVTTLERRLLAIATECTRIFTSDPRPDTQLPGVAFATPVGNDTTSYPVSQFAVLGSMGPDLPGFSALLQAGQSWVFDTIHKGTPDANRELVNAQTNDFIMEFWAQARAKIISEVGPGTNRDKALDKMRAYVLGHLCHTAADVISHPYVNDFQWERAPHDLSKFHEDAEGEMDALVAQQLLRRASTRSGQDWDSWWPKSDEVPEHFFRAYRDALEQVYSATGRARKGYGEFEEELEQLGIPALDAEFLRDGYHMYRHGVISMGYGYGYWSWWWWLSLLFVPAIAAPFMAAGLPNSRALLLRDEPETERAFLEFMTAPMLFGLPAALGFGILLGTRTTHGVAGQYWLGMSGLILTALLGGVFIGTLRAERLPATFSWPVLFGVPAAIGVVHSIAAIVQGSGDIKRKGRMALSLIFALPLLLALVVFLLFGLMGGAAAQTDSDSPFKSPPFWAFFAIWLILLGVAWFVLPRVLRDIRIPEQPAGGKIGKRFVRLFDDTTLHQDAQLAGLEMPSLVYPANRRKLMKLWWEGAGEKHLRSDRFALVFADDDAGTNPQVVPAPIVPMTLDEYRLFLEAQVPGVKGELLFPENPENSDNPDYLLPAGATFSDHGDGEKITVLHNAAAARFQELGDSADDTDYILYHAPKQRLAVLHGTRGTVPPTRNVGAAPVAHDPETEGYDYLHDPTNFETSEALMSYAGDFGALLCLGATTHMSDLRDSANQDVDPVYQVFRNWNLDRRRVNEWRALVAGGAENDKGGNRAGYDTRMLKHGGPADPAGFRSPLLGAASPAEQAAFDEGEATTRQLGWVGLLRAWLEVVRLPAENPLATDLTKTGNPPNQALSRAMAYLFDLADPGASP